MDCLYLFYENSTLKGVFDDIKKLKEKSLTAIIDYHLDNKVFKDKEECKKNLRDKFIDFLKEENGFLENSNTIWSIVKCDKNVVCNNIRGKSYDTRFTKLTIKGKSLTKKDLYRDLAYLELTPLYTKKL